MICDGCGQDRDDVMEDVVEPFQADVNNLVCLVNYCPDCYANSADDI